MTDTMWAGLAELSAELADFYQDLHEHPELSLQEHRTARLVADALWPLGFEVTEQVGGTRGGRAAAQRRRSCGDAAR